MAPPPSHQATSPAGRRRPAARASVTSSPRPYAAEAKSSADLPRARRERARVMSAWSPRSTGAGLPVHVGVPVGVPVLAHHEVQRRGVACPVERDAHLARRPLARAVARTRSWPGTPGAEAAPASPRPCREAARPTRPGNRGSMTVGTIWSSGQLRGCRNAHEHTAAPCPARSRTPTDPGRRRRRPQRPGGSPAPTACRGSIR